MFFRAGSKTRLQKDTYLNIQSRMYEPQPAHVHGDIVQEDPGILGGRQLCQQPVVTELLAVNSRPLIISRDDIGVWKETHSKPENEFSNILPGITVGSLLLTPL